MKVELNYDKIIITPTGIKFITNQIPDGGKLVYKKEIGFRKSIFPLSNLFPSKTRFLTLRCLSLPDRSQSSFDFDCFAH